ncbi:efflux RND transporter permease subunit [bacterium]|nr:efflux RND transporter permease subunit [candidate division CSSED10-310 bacterium]
MSIAAFSIRRRITVFMVTIGTLVLGLFSLNRLELKLLPDISYPSLTVRTEMEGTPPEEIENLISRPVEEVLGIVGNLQQITSVSRAGLSDVIVEFQWNTPMDKALMDVREKLDTVILPDNAERPRILRYNPETEPIMKLALTGDDLVALHLFAENELKSRLETLPGVAAVRIMGGEEEEIRIDVDTRRLSALGMTLADVSRRLSMENINLPGGMLEDGDSRFLVRTLNEFLTEDDIGEVVVASVKGADIRLKDIATIDRGPIERKTITRLNGQASVLLDIYKEGDANIIKVADAVRSETGTFKTQPDRGSKPSSSIVPKGMDLVITSDQSTFIRAAISEVRSAAVLGCLLAVAVIFFFLRHVPNTLIIGLSIPISIIATFTLMYFRHISLNLMSLGGLALGIGMLVDNSIVVLENIFRIRESGETPFSAAKSGTEQVTTAVIASTLTTIAVFFPIVFVKGIAGQVFSDLAWTIAFSLLASLAVALSFIPMVASIGITIQPNPDDVIPILRLWRQGWQMNENGYRASRILRTMRFLLGHMARSTSELIKKYLGPAFHRLPAGRITSSRLTAVLLFPFRFFYSLLSLTLIILGVGLVNGSWIIIAIPIFIVRVSWRLIRWVIHPFLSSFNYSFVVLQIGYRRLLKYSLRHPLRGPIPVVCLLGLAALYIIPNLGMDLIPAMAQGEFFIDLRMPVGTPLEQTRDIVSRVETLMNDIPGIQTVSSIIGSDMTSTATLGAEQEHMATLQVLLKPDVRDSDSETLVIASLRASLADVTGIQKLEFRRPSLLTIRTPLVVEVRGNDLDDIMSASRLLAERLRQDPSFKDVSSTMESGYPEIQVIFNRTKLARLGLTPNNAADTMQNAIEGDVPTHFGLAGEEVDIRIRAERINDLSPDDIRNLVIDPTALTPITLGSVAEISRSVGPSEIRRVSQRRVAIVKTETPFLDLRRASEKVQTLIAQQPNIPGIYYAVTGQTGDMNESATSLLIALCMAVFLVYLVMASQFESLLQPLIILISIPLGFIGVLIGLEFLQIPLSVVVFIGLIVLAGIAVNNAIVLVDTTNQIVRNGSNPLVAITEAADQRLRPIMMTAMTTVLGLLPMALATGPGEEIRRPLAITVILGLVVSTFLTLILIPVVYSLIYRHRPAEYPVAEE